jgi:hypothetical protein
MNLKHLTDNSLLLDTKTLVLKEREFLTKILHHLKEIDKRKLYSDLGYSSLFAYCIRELGYSESNAYRRIQACRLLASMPEIEHKIENGFLSLSNIAQASQFFNQNEIDDLSDQRAVLNQLENLSKKEGEKMLFAISGEDKAEKDNIRRVSSDKTRLSIILSDITIDKCELLKDLLGKNLSYQELIDYMVEISIKDIEKKKFKILSLNKVSLPPAKVNRVIRSSVKREAYLRDQKCVKCGSTRNLNFDHRVPFALGGASEPENIRMLCFNCNQRSRMSARL